MKVQNIFRRDHAKAGLVMQISASHFTLLKSTAQICLKGLYLRLEEPKEFQVSSTTGLS